jgi:hypothetical protein
MKKLLAALTLTSLVAASPAFASAQFTIDFENSWAYGTAVDNFYAGSGVTFTNVLGLSNNDGLGSLSNGDYYQNAPSPLGVGVVQLDGVVNTTSFMNVAAGVENKLSFFYSSIADVTGAIKAYSGLNGTGTLLGTFNMTGNTADFTNWSLANFSFSGTAKSFDLSATNGVAGLDNIQAVPEPESYASLLAGLALLGVVARRRKSSAS